MTGKSYRIKTVVIDAGHGGHDTGCLGSSSKEKNIALAVSLKLGKLIEDNYPDVNVVYTRKTDVFIDLRERAEIANRQHADLFICIHCNSGGKAAFGVETFVMGLHKTQDNLSVSMRENSSILLEKDYKQKYDGYDPNSAESFIIFNLYQSAYIDKSLIFASKVQFQVENFGNRYNRGVKQAGFLVLYKTAMPSVLIETGFLTNVTEEKFLFSEKGQSTIANSIYRAFKEYKIDIEVGDGGTGNPPPEKPKQQPEMQENKNKEPEVKPVVKSPEKKDSVLTQSPVKETNKPLETPETRKPDSIKIAAEYKKPAETVKPVLPKSTQKDSLKTKTTEKPDVILKDDKVTSDLFYTIQIGASPTATEAEKKHFKIDGLKIIKSEDGMNRFTVGQFDTPEKANTKLSQIKQQGFKDAFVTPYYNGKRISMADAKKILQKK